MRLRNVKVVKIKSSLFLIALLLKDLIIEIIMYINKYVID